ncbi:MAG: substrate-binding domain-containing protein [Massilia sp.]
MPNPPPHRIALLLDPDQLVHRELIAGISAQFAQTRASWDLMLEHDFRLRLRGIEHWQGDGIIGDVDDPAVAAALARCKVPVVGIGGARADVAAYPAMGFVGPDNEVVIALAYRHLIEAGLRQFAMFSEAASPRCRAAREREQAFCDLMRRERGVQAIYRGTGAPLWDESTAQIIAWLRSLPKPVGIIAVNAARGRQLMQACELAGIAVPDEVAIVGIGYDPLLRKLERIPLSTVRQDVHEMGRHAARQLARMIGGSGGAERTLVAPVGLDAQASSLHQPSGNPLVRRALHFIRLQACDGINTEQVAAYLDVSRTSLESWFRRELGNSVHGVIMRAKLDAAIEMLSTSDASVAEVAECCGFTSLQYIHTVFRRELGCSPCDYQREPHDSELPQVRAWDRATGLAPVRRPAQRPVLRLV